MIESMILRNFGSRQEATETMSAAVAGLVNSSDITSGLYQEHLRAATQFPLECDNLVVTKNQSNSTGTTWIGGTNAKSNKNKSDGDRVIIITRLVNGSGNLLRSEVARRRDLYRALAELRALQSARKNKEASGDLK